MDTDVEKPAAFARRSWLGLKMNCIFLIGTIIAVIFGISAVIYVAFSLSNPHIIQIIIGSVAVGIVIGISSSLVSTFFKDQIHSRPGMAALMALSSLSILIALLVYSSNQPKSIKREIPVTYFVHLSTKELPATLCFPSSTTSSCYDDITAIFRKFKERSPENSQKVDELLSANIAPTASSLRIFHDLTEYLIPYFIGHTFVTPEAEQTMYRKETSKWLGFPDESIACNPKSLDQISGPFNENLFYGIKGMAPGIKIQMRLPKDTEITLEKNKGLVSTFFLKNAFFKQFTIGIRQQIGSSGYHAFLHPDAFYPSHPFSPSPFADKIEKEKLGPFKRYDCIIYYDVVFDKWRYGSPSMKYYEEWANNLFSVLQRKFAWGSPILLDPLSFSAPKTKE